MSILGRFLVDSENISSEQLQSLFSIARREDGLDFRDLAKHRTVGLIFLEPSTRTRISFEMASHRLGARTIHLNSTESSLQKGETLQDTLLNLSAMGVDLFVVRHGTSERLSVIQQNLSKSLINAGEGSLSHPTQALVDLFTIFEFKKIKHVSELRGQRWLFIGDGKHSRVVSSHLPLLGKLGVEVGCVGPSQWLLESSQGNSASVKSFNSLRQALEWATIVEALRVQKERHDIKGSILDFQLNSENLKSLSDTALILHPGPVNWGMELDPSVRQDSRSLILKQVEFGVHLRTILLADMMGLL